MSSWAEVKAATMTRETRETGLESLQEKVSTFRLRAEPGITVADLLARLQQATVALEGPGKYHAEQLLGEMLIDLLCLARKERLDLAFHAKRAFARMQRGYEDSNG